MARPRSVAESADPADRDPMSTPPWQGSVIAADGGQWTGVIITTLLSDESPILLLQGSSVPFCPVACGVGSR